MRPLSIMFDSNTIDAERMTSHSKANRCVKDAGTIVSGP